MVPIIDPEDDYLTIAAAEEQMAITHDMRQKDLHEAHAKLKREFSPVSLPRSPSLCPLSAPLLQYSPIYTNDCLTRTYSTPELAKVLDAARVSATRPASIPSAEEHVAHMNDLDGTRLSLAKAINDVEGALAGKEAELARLKEEIRTLETSDPAAEHDLDATA